MPALAWLGSAMPASLFCKAVVYTDALNKTMVLLVLLTIRSPAVFIISNKGPPWVCGQSGLACARQAKEQGHITTVAHVAAAVQGQHAALGHQVVHHTTRQHSTATTTSQHRIAMRLHSWHFN